MSRPIEIHGVQVRDLTQSPPDDQALARVSQALQLVASADAASARRIREDLRRVLLMRSGVVRYVPQLDACLVPIRELDSQSVAHLAMTLVQQSSRAQAIRTKGWDRDDAGLTAEETALNTALAFGRSVNAAPEDLIAFQMRRSYTETYFSDPERPYDDLRSLGVPNWALRALQRLRESFQIHTRRK